MRRLCWPVLLVVLSIFCDSAFAQTEKHPRLLVMPEEKPAILNKIGTQPWAQAAYDDMMKRINVYADRHEKDPEWILSRYLMNWEDGKHYTDFYTYKDQILNIERSEGNAPYPTVRVAVQGRVPVNEKGTRYRIPEIDELVPFDTSAYMYLYNPDAKTKEKVKPLGYVEIINGKINTLVLESAILYWLTDNKKYAKFAADVLNQWARGAWYQNQIHGYRSYGFIGLQTLDDLKYQPLILAYDFLYPYLKAEGYEMKYYQNIFEKFVRASIFNGFNDCNWFAAENTTLVYGSLLLDDTKKRDYYLSYFFDKDTIDWRWGHVSLKTAVDTWFTPDGHWKETAGYHSGTVMGILKAALAAEKNGYPVLLKYSSLFKAASVIMKYAYPNLYISTFGNAARTPVNPELIELGMVFAEKDRPEELPQLQACWNLLTTRELYSRDKADYFGLLTYIPEVKNTGETYRWPRSGGLDFARLYLQRNGTDKDYGLMYTVQGGRYNHNHANGMSMELYGPGEVTGIDPGVGPYYEHPVHMQYFYQWAAHNTVTAGGKSGALPLKQVGIAEIGEIRLQTMEPMPDTDAVSPFVSFTDTRYTDRSTGTEQQRTMAIVRTSDKTGFYVDIFRSNNPVRNDYMYHNIGNGLWLETANGKSVTTRPGSIPLVDNDIPGFRFIDSVQSTGIFSDDLTAVFALDNSEPRRMMRAFIIGDKDRSYFTGLSPASNTAGSYVGKKMPTLMIHAPEEAWSKPFAVVYEPAFKNGASLKKVSRLTSDDQSKHIALKAEDNSGIRYIFQGTDSEAVLSDKRFRFSGFFGVASVKSNKTEYLYLGQGKLLSFGDCTITVKNGPGSFHISFSDNGMTVTCDREIEINIKKKTYTCPAGKEKFYRF